MKIVIENVSDGEIIPHNVLLIRGRVDNLDSSLLEGKLKHKLIFRFGHAAYLNVTPVHNLSSDAFIITCHAHLGPSW